MTDTLAPILTGIAAAARAVRGVHRIYPPTRSSTLVTALTALSGRDVDAPSDDLIHVDGTEATIAIAVTDEFPAPKTAARVHDLLLAQLVAAGVDITVVHVRVVQID
ncbi:hypothetical protein [Curtobacterium sp. ME12]|uniref:hypothetical protein n=1 Tax=Curtobacterium sp. ME12 TaxID=2744253 RepID=UPI0015F3B50A|nr:hypothetical protein [Curtobacterium sp. ME12]